MARRKRMAFGSRWLQSSVDALTRAAMRTGAQAFKQALRTTTLAPKRSTSKRASAKRVSAKRPSVKRTPAKRTPTIAAVAKRKPVQRSSSPTGWTSGFAIGPAGARRYHLYKPPGVRRSERLPLVVMLHGCGQDAAAIAASSRIDRIASRERFLVLYPEQDRLANAQRCWNWYDTRSGRAQGEAALIDTAIEQVCALQPVDRNRIAIAGLSAGAGMAALLAIRRPERFRAVAMHSGIAPGVAHSAATALSAMRGQRRSAGPLPAVDGSTSWPALLVIQGSADRIVARQNGVEAVRLWAGHAGAREAPSRVVQRGARRPATLTDYHAAGRLVASLCEVDGLGHAWSGGASGPAYSDPKGPDATRMIWTFAVRQFAAAKSV
jgi:poly(hydroxyalkanoate) depolymerase family esterase